MVGEPQPKLLTLVCQRLLAQLPPDLTQDGLREFIEQHRDWDREFPGPVELAEFDELVFHELLGKIATAGVIMGQELCPQCGKSLPPASLVPSLVVCSACGFESQALFSVDQAKDTVAWDPKELPTRFQLKVLLGEGSFGRVYRAWDSKLQRDVAIKIPRFECLDRDIFLREARAASRLSHPNIVRIYDVGEIGALTFIVSDLIRGTTLGRWAATTKPSIKTACEVMLKIAQAMEFAHREDVIHRDLKPGNILIDDQREPVVVDFGLSHSRSNQFESIAKQGKPLGTPAFMSPEQVQGQLDRIGTWTDVYGMGVILYQLVTDTLPFTGSTEDIYEEIVGRPVVTPRRRNPKIAPALEAIILKAMEKTPENRYATAHEFAEDLRLYLAGEPVTAYRKWDRRVVGTYSRRYFLAALAVLLTGGLLGVMSYWRAEWLANNPLTTVSIDSDPADAHLTWLRLDEDLAEWDTASQVQSAAGKVTQLPPGFYKITARSGSETFEVFRTVPAADQIPTVNYRGMGPLPHRYWTTTDSGFQLPPIRIVPVNEMQADMVFVAGGVLGFDENPFRPMIVKNQSKTVGRFLIDRTEVTYRELLQVFGDFQTREAPNLDSPCLVDWDVAVAYAEKVGKNVPELWELLYVATNGGTTKFPWGDQFIQGNGADGFNQLTQIDQTLSPAEIKFLVTGVPEWTVDRAMRRIPELNLKLDHGDLNQFQVLGWEDWSEAAMKFIEQSEMPPIFEVQARQHPNRVGFRCVRRLDNQ